MGRDAVYDPGLILECLWSGGLRHAQTTGGSLNDKLKRIGGTTKHLFLVASSILCREAPPSHPGVEMGSWSHSHASESTALSVIRCQNYRLGKTQSLADAPSKSPLSRGGPDCVTDNEVWTSPNKLELVLSLE